MSTTLTATHILVGGQRLPFLGIANTSKAYMETISRLDLGNSQTPQCLIIDGSTVVAHVSYNGRVWEGAFWSPGQTPIYQPAYEVAS